jgi:hypothetical protein
MNSGSALRTGRMIASRLGGGVGSVGDVGDLLTGRDCQNVAQTCKRPSHVSPMLLQRPDPNRKVIGAAA